MAYAVAGRYERARSQHVLPICFAYVHPGLGEDDKALQWLEKAHEQHDSHLLFPGVSPIYDPLRSHPGFSALLREMKLEP